MARANGANDETQRYTMIAAELRERIRAGEFAPGTLLPTERELQERHGVSRSTVRRAMSRLIQTGWAEALPNRGVAAKLGPAQDRTNNVAFVDHGDSMNVELFFKLNRRLQQRSFNLVHIDSRQHGFEGALEQAVEGRFSGAVVWSKEGFPDRRRLQEVMRFMPVIAVDHGLRGIPTDLVGIDDFEGGRQMVHHLHKLGRRRIAITGMLDMLDVTHERLSGYLKGMFDVGLNPNSADFLFTHTSGMESCDTSFLEARLRDADRPDALFVTNDSYFNGIVQCVFDAGLRIPDDVALVTYGGGARFTIDDVSLTVIEYPMGRVADVAVESLIARMENPHLPVQHLTMPVNLVVGGSCGAPRSAWCQVNQADAPADSPMNPWRGMVPHIHFSSQGAATSVPESATATLRSKQ